MEGQRLTVSVSQLNHYIKRVLEHNGYLKDICIKAEISNFKPHPSGHLYLTLKDEGSVLRAVMFRSEAQKLRFMPSDGMKVLAYGRISVYEPGGNYQLYIENLEADGEGTLYAAYEALKKKLEEEGLFSQSHKKPIPAFPEVVSVVTAESGAAVRDIINILGRRYPTAQVKLFPVSVQGATAAPEIARAISILNEKNIGDVMIVGRGGGSIEDLWAFNEEIVARAIFASNIPVISAVGHETDFTISDFVADLRAPTPSAAAELATPDSMKLRQNITSARQHMSYALNEIVARMQQKLERLKSHPAFSQFENRLAEKRMEVDSLYQNAETAFLAFYQTLQNKLALHGEKLQALSPLSALGRGYAIATDEGDKLLTSVNDFTPGKHFTLRVSDGLVSASAHSANKNPERK